MNCQEIQAQLSEYVDLSLNAAQLTLIEGHLTACSSCREEVELLGESIRQVAALPVMETPLGFTQRVMSHVREIETQPSFWQRFLLPLSGKIPAQATALVIVGFLGIYLLQREEPQLPLTPGPGPETTTPAKMTQESAPATISDLSSPEIDAFRASESPIAQTAPGASPRETLQSDARTESRSRAANVALPPISNAPAPQLAEPAVRATPIASGTPVVTGPAQPASVTTFSTPPELDSAALRAAPATIELFADLELIVRRHTTPPAEARGDVAAELRKAEVSQETAERPATPRPIDRLMAAIPDRTRPQTIWITVPQDQYEQFKRELQTLGVIESETRVPLLRDQAANQDGHIRVKLTALPAGETATSHPATGR